MLYLHEIYFEHTESFEDFNLASSDFFSINVTFKIGEELEGDNFSFDIINYCNLELISKIYKELDIYFIKKGELAMKSFDKKIILEFLNYVVNEANLLNSKNVLDKYCIFRKYFNWEYDNYVDL